MFSGQHLAQIGLDPGTLYPHVLRRPVPVTFERADRSRMSSVDRSQIANDRSSGVVTVVNKELMLTEEEEDLADILSPINDELSLSKSWWFLEIMPLKYKHQRKDGTWIWRTRYVIHNRIVLDLLVHPLFPRPNMANGRYIPRGDNYKIRVHRTVKLRMDADEAILREGRRYVPRAKPWEDHRVEWVD